ncbi:MAG: hypothetical protein KatS3mg003_2331 [Candidatus Nitrosocaldaceae archaeon]|nr:MAG: hypothetical protein KatS3mg003_2101 [Candidatus Nitrosocaldaceae archaeon]GIU72852.1 MAG: hypothetical protein KatS3mg003_2331 [Candidatus Nitrosocaldaceae archaeon]
MDLASNLKIQTSMLLDLFNNRLNTISSTKELLKCIKHVSHKELDEYKAIGIDGSMDYEERLDMLLFYVNAVAFTARLKSNRFDDIRRSNLKISTAIPLWKSDIGSLIEEEDNEFDIRYSSDKIPYSFMTMAELKLAADAITNYKDLKLVLLDRSLLRTYAPLTRDVQMLIRKKSSPLIDIDTEYGKVSMLDIILAYMLGDASIYIPPRGSYARYAIIKELLDGEKSIEELKLRIDDIDKHIDKIKKLDKHFKGLLLARSDSVLSLTDYAKDYWKRISSMTNKIINNIFNSYKYPLLLNDKWLSLVDISALNLFLLYDIIGKVLKNRIFMIGIIKDMNTTEFIRAVIPYLVISKRLSIDRLELSNDRSFFTMLSATNESIKTPWRSIAYDAAFTTLVYDKRFKAARKAIFRERLFIRSYFQLRTYKHDQGLRSPVFLYDRIFYPDDADSLIELEAEEWNKISRLSLFVEDDSCIDNLYLNILAASDSKEIFEAYGHNYLLYLADKAAKFDVKHMRSMLTGVSNLYLSKEAAKNKVLSISKSFRDQRYEEEKRRR